MKASVGGQLLRLIVINSVCLSMLIEALEFFNRIDKDTIEL